MKQTVKEDVIFVVGVVLFCLIEGALLAFPTYLALHFIVKHW